MHHELRDGDSVVTNHPTTFEAVNENSTTSLAPLTVSPPMEPTETPSATPPEPTDVGGGEATDEPSASARSAWKWYAAFTGLALALGVVAAYALSFYSRANAAAERAVEAQQRAERIATGANERIEAARQDATAQIIQARDAASKAQMTTDVLAAPDLVRFNMTGGDSAARISAQLLWSRSRGLVFSGSRMPAPPPGALYQVWLLTAGDPVSAGTAAPDASGRVTIATDTPPNVPRPIVGVRVTVEPAPGSPSPSGATVLVRAP